MNNTIASVISKSLNLELKAVNNVIKLLEEGSTVPFISRYRKEMTGSMDEVNVLAVKENYEKLLELEKRKETIIKTIEEGGNMTPELLSLIKTCYNSTDLEDIYLPYKPKRKTKASDARDKGLEPLAKIIMKQHELNIEERAKSFLNNEVVSVQEALQGARYIISEWISENKKARSAIRNLFERTAVIYSKSVDKKCEEDKDNSQKYKDYFEFHEPLKRSPSHRLLAMFRGENEGFLRISIEPLDEDVSDTLEKIFVTGVFDVSEQVRISCEDAYKRLLKPSIATEFKNMAKEKADEGAISVFAENLRQLLLAPPLGAKRILAIDPGYRTGCKVVCIDEQGNILTNTTIFPHPPQKESGAAAKKIDTLVEQYKIEAIAIGNGTASRETEAFVKKVKFNRDLQVFVVSEAGASVYSASATAREEMPSYDVTVRGAASIGRRLMDPLAELVKIDPKSIGVGQYQHDVDQNKLSKSLDIVVESCVNIVGVDVNTASKHLLNYVSGLGKKTAENIVEYRKNNGPFKSRKEFKKVSGLGPKAYEQCAGFLKIPNALNPLDNSAVHPESYHIVEKMAKSSSCEVVELIKNEEIRSKLNPADYVESGIGLPTISDIIKELAKPGRDPRAGIKVFEFDSSIRTIDDVKDGAVYPGIVTNITNFGCFVDIGVKQDGLIHISQMADKFISDPNEIVKLHQHLKVKVLFVDRDRKRIQLTLKGV